jgi:hypothetical protein
MGWRQAAVVSVAGHFVYLDQSHRWRAEVEGVHRRVVPNAYDA